MTHTVYKPWVPEAEQERRWERLGLLRDLVEGAAWGWPINDPNELARREARIDTVLGAMAEMAPAGFFHGDR